MKKQQTLYGMEVVTLNELVLLFSTIEISSAVFRTI